MSNIKKSEDVNGIQFIPVDQLHHHPDNPRKDLGDLSELTASIKAKGILQNLTVVPKPDIMGYLVVIGNRRLEAAKAAGLERLPCIIANMTLAEQVQTMLLENIQRADLTVYEQAQGFQMMIDFGDNIDTVSKMTGFSKTTIRRRLELAKLDGATLKKVSERQISILDLDKLSKIEDIKQRNKVLETIGTVNFEYELRRVLQEQKRKADEARWRVALKEAGIKEISNKDLWSDKYRSPNHNNYFYTSDKVTVLDDLIEKGQEYFFAFSGGFGYLRIKNIKDANSEEPEKIERQEALKRERIKSLDEAFSRAYELRAAFVSRLSETGAKKLFTSAVLQIAKDRNLYDDLDVTASILGFELGKDEDREVDVDDLEDLIASSPYKALIALAYTTLDDSSRQKCIDWQGEYYENENFKDIYTFLEALGYEISDEEKALMDGTSELYKTEDAENGEVH